MGWYRQFINMLRPDRLSSDIRREMEFHMAERADDLVAGGMTEPDARREARVHTRFRRALEWPSAAVGFSVSLC